MKNHLEEFNTWVDYEIRQFSEAAQSRDVKASYKGGIIIPFGYRDIEDPLVILNCIPDLSVIFETKERAPFKVVFEVCKLSEVKELVQNNLDLEAPMKLTNSFIKTLSD